MAMADTWWRDGVLYQIYPRSFADSNGDGVGDLRGIIDRLDHLEWLGIDGIWLNPTMPSPNDDWGYDVSDYCDVHPDLGTLEDLDALVAACRERGMAVLLDLVPNHTSDRHAVVRRRDDGPRRALPRLLRLGRPGARTAGRRTTGCRTSAARPGSWHEPTGQYYLNNFLPSQPDLNWWNDEVRDAFDEILRFWYERGIDGWRIDVCHAIVKDRELRDDPAVTRGRPPAGAEARAQARVLDEPARGARRAAPLARAVGRAGPAAGAGGGDIRARPRPADPLLRQGRGRAAPRVQLPVRARRPRGGRAAHDRRGRRGEAAAAVVAGLHGLQPRCRPARDALGAGTTSGERASR